MLPPPEGSGACRRRSCASCPATARTSRRTSREARKIMEGLGYGPDKPLKLKVSTRDIAIYRDPAVILIDQLKKIHIDGELDVVDTASGTAKVTRKRLRGRPQPDRRRLDDPDVNFYENYACKSERNYTQYCNPEVEKLIDAAVARSGRREAQGRWSGRSSASCTRTWRGRSSIQRAGHLLAAACEGLHAARRTASTTAGGSKTSGSTSRRRTLLRRAMAASAGCRATAALHAAVERLPASRGRDRGVGS